MGKYKGFKSILFCIDVMRCGGGAQKVLPIILKTLMQEGIQVKLLVLKKTENLVDLSGLDVTFILQSEQEQLMPNAFFILDMIVKEAKKYDLLVSFMDFITSYFVALGAKIISKPYDIFVRCEPSFVVDTFAQSMVNKELYKMCFMGARQIVCNSKSSCLDVMDNFKIPKDRVFLLYNPITPLEMGDSPRFWVEELKAKEGLFCFASGRLHPQKNYLRLLEVFKGLQELSVKLFILGDGEQRDVLEQYIVKNGMKNVCLLGFQKNPYIFLKEADIFVHNSLYEGFPNVVLEAASLKKPLLLSSIKTLKEIFDNDSAMYCDPYDVSDMERKIKILLNDKNMRDRLADRAYASVLGFSMEAFRGQVLGLFKEMRKNIRKTFV